MMAVRQLTSMREQLWLLAHDHRDLRPLIDVRALAIGLAAAVLTDLASRPSVEDVLTRARRRVATTGSLVPADDILNARDADRR